MASPKSMWSGSLQLGLLTCQVTIGKATSEQRETSITTVCDEHKVKINRTERCGAGHEGCSMVKRRAIEDQDGKWHVLAENEYTAIEDATKSSTLLVLDAQPYKALPLEFGMGTYYLRPDAGVKGSEHAFALLHAALAKSHYGLVVKWCRSASQKLCVVHAAEGIILLTQIPFLAELRRPDKQERAHWSVECPDEQVDMAVKLVKMTSNSSGFAYEEYEDEGYKMRAEAVDKVLGEKAVEASEDQVVNLMAQITASIEAAKA